MLDDPGDRWHVAVLEADPDERARSLCRLDDAPTRCNGRTQGLLDEARDAGVDHVEEDSLGGHVGTGDHHRIEVSSSEEVAMVLVGVEGCTLGDETGPLE